MEKNTTCFTGNTELFLKTLPTGKPISSKRLENSIHPLKEEKCAMGNSPFLGQEMLQMSSMPFPSQLLYLNQKAFFRRLWRKSLYRKGKR